MKFISTNKTNKRGQKYSTRSTKVANGFSKHFATRCPDKFLKLAVKGTFDVLAATRFDFIWITVMHPEDNSYTKQVRILRKNKRKFLDRIPKDLRNIYRYVK